MCHNNITTNQKCPEHFIVFVTEVRDRTCQSIISAICRTERSSKPKLKQVARRSIFAAGLLCLILFHSIRAKAVQNMLRAGNRRLMNESE